MFILNSNDDTSQTYEPDLIYQALSAIAEISLLLSSVASLKVRRQTSKMR